MNHRVPLDPSKFEAPISALAEAYLYAEDTDSATWDFAVSIAGLFRMGLSESDIRWLMRKEVIAHRREITTDGDGTRVFRSTGNLALNVDSCFVLTDLEAPNRIEGLLTDASSDRLPSRPQRVPRSQPQWHSTERRLLFGEVVVKRFRWPAANQELVLCAFQEEGWPVRVDDPLAPNPEQDSKRRLADTIKCLNRKQENALVQFHGDGTGQGVTWERIRN